MISTPRRHSLAWKTSRAIALAALFLIGAGAAGIHTALNHKLEQSARRHALSIARSIGYYAESFAGQEGLQRMVFAAAAERGVASVMVAGGPHEIILAASSSDWVGRPAPARRSVDALLGELDPAGLSANPLVVTLPINLSARDSLRNYPARVIVALDSGPVRQAVRQTVWLSISAYGLAILALTLIALAVLKRNVVSRLNDLARRHLAGSGKPAASPEADEINLLDTALENTFREMAAALSKRDQLRFAHERFGCAVTLDDGGIILNASPDFAALVGKRREKLAGSEYQQLLLEDDRSADLPSALAGTAPDGSSWSGELRFKNDAGLRWLAVTALPLSTGSGAAVILLHHDVTALKSVEQTLRRLSARLAAAEELVRLGSWDLLPDGTFLWSGEMLRLHGITVPSPSAPQALFALYTPADAARLGIAFARAASHREKFDLVCRLVHDNGPIRWLRVCGLPARGETGLITGFAQDVTSSHEAELALRTTENRLQSVVRFQRDLLCRFLPDGTITYVNTPCCLFFGREEACLLGASLYQILPERHRDRARSHVSRILAEKHSGARITEETHSADGRSVVIEWQTTLFYSDQGHVSEILAAGTDVTDRIRAENARRDIEHELETLLATGTEPLCFTDLDGRVLRANQALARLVDRTRADVDGRLLAELIHPADVAALRAALHSLRENPSSALVALRHSGPKAAALEWHLHRRERRIVATARTALPPPPPPAPNSAPSPQTLPAPTSPPPATTPDAKTRILLAEDNPINQQVVTGLLARVGLQPDVVGDGQAALDALADRDYDLVLMDIQMPVLDGLAATRILRACPPGGRPDPATPVVGLTAHALPQDRAAGMAAGLDDYLTKPISPQVLFEVVRRLARAPVVAPPMPAEKAPAPEVATSAIDRAELLRRFMGDETLARRILPKFRTQLEQARDVIAEALRTHDSERALRELHNLKGAARNLSAHLLATAIAPLESALRTGADPADPGRQLFAAVVATLDALEIPPASPPST